jgi:hypothetical protein
MVFKQEVIMVAMVTDMVIILMTVIEKDGESSQLLKTFISVFNMYCTVLAPTGATLLFWWSRAYLLCLG